MHDDNTDNDIDINYVVYRGLTRNSGAPGQYISGSPLFFLLLSFPCISI